MNDVIDYSFKDSNIEQTFVDKLIKIHKQKSLYGCKLGDKRGGKNNIHSWDIGYNGYVSDEERSLMNKIMLEYRGKNGYI